MRDAALRRIAPHLFERFAADSIEGSIRAPLVSNCRDPLHYVLVLGADHLVGPARCRLAAVMHIGRMNNNERAHGAQRSSHEQMTCLHTLLL